MAQPPAPPVLPANMTLQQAEMMGPDGNNPYYPEGGDLSGGLPINLDSLRDGPPGSKPFYPYSTLIRYAIKGSPTGKLLLEDIYYAVESRFPYFRSAPAGWKNSVRHNLSLNPCFVKVPRPLTDRGKGSYWTVDDNVDPRTGVHRIRKKKTKKDKTEATEREPEFPEGSAEYNPERGPEAFNPEAHAQFVQQLDEQGTSRAPQVYTPGYPPTYDPSYQMLGMRYPPMPIISPDEHLPTDEHGNVDWRLTWHKELSDLQQHTAEQDKNNAAQEWYRVMFFRLRSGLMATYDPTGPFPAPGAPHGLPHEPQEVPQDAAQVHE